MYYTTSIRKSVRTCQKRKSQFRSMQLIKKWGGMKFYMPIHQQYRSQTKKSWPQGGQLVKKSSLVEYLFLPVGIKKCIT